MLNITKIQRRRVTNKFISELGKQKNIINLSFVGSFIDKNDLDKVNDIDLIEPGLSNGYLDLTSEYVTQTLNRNFGLDYQLSYPFSKYSRLEGGVNYDYFIRQIIKTDYWGDETSMNYESENLVKPHMRYIFDNTRWFFHIAGVQSDLTEKYIQKQKEQLLIFMDK